ncbi:MAG: cytochrome P450 [Kibdelosporangium sp.]
MTVDLMDPELVRDPFTVYSRVRGPLVRGLIPGAQPLWLATRHEDVRLVLTDPRFVTNLPGSLNVTAQLLTAAGIPEDYIEYIRPGLFDHDGPEHVRLRTLVSHAFTARGVTKLRPRVEEIAETLLAKLPVEDGTVDLLQHFAYPLPITVIGELVGIPERDRAQFWQWTQALSVGFGPGMTEAMPAMADYTRQLIERRRDDPAPDLITELIQARDGQRLTETETVAMVLNLVVAGYETTANLVANGLIALLNAPDQLALLRREPDLTPRAVQELMRFCGPGLGMMPRYATVDVQLGDVLVGRGEAVIPVVAAANRDPAVFDDPDRLDISRDAGRHLGFGYGPHHCLGAALARQEAEVAFRAVLDRFPDLALAGAPERGANPGTWHFANLPVRAEGQHEPKDD